MIAKRLAELLKDIFKKAAVPLLLGVVTLLAFKFFMWNSWKVERTKYLAESYFNAPSAVNLELSRGPDVLFEKSFPYNPAGRYYLVNGFDIMPYVKEEGKIGFLGVAVTVNRPRTRPDRLYRFKDFNIMEVQGAYFVFTSAGGGIKNLVRLRKNLPVIIPALPYLDPVRAKGAVYRTGDEFAVVLAYGRGRYSTNLDGALAPGTSYQLELEYKCEGGTGGVPIVLLGRPPFSGEDFVFRHSLERAGPGYRVCLIRFKTGSSGKAPRLHLLVRRRRGGGEFDTMVFFKKISLSLLYGDEPGRARPGQAAGVKIAYADQVEAAGEEFVRTIKLQPGKVFNGNK
jgi:hypothetical protein